eukprot:CAMPEP_0172013784 /NCGR_PEP_ID=MMETSP1041-20130122/9577_1 /TAXON_ID=464988 /ORGANISM="Hemiselmis andersenii, Strain CCMP439" /LENGTH=166 /DNA_ID=CAMNT_0012668493 /DNA_START=36 /DNA_END=533 /DNA_ORIENTATION=+
MAEIDSETLACTYAALILHDDGLPIVAENMTKLIKAAGVEVESFWPGMFAKALADADINELCMKIGSDAPASGGGGGGDAAPAAGGGGDAPAAKKKEPEPEEDDGDMGFSLFDWQLHQPFGVWVVHLRVGFAAPLKHGVEKRTVALWPVVPCQLQLGHACSGAEGG